jgi:hypothetical protein
MTLHSKEHLPGLGSTEDAGTHGSPSEGHPRTMLRLNVVHGERNTASMPPSGEALVRGRGGVPYIVGGEVDSQYWIDVADVGTFRFHRGSDGVRAEIRPGTDSELLLHVFRTNILPIALHVIHGYESLHASAVLVRPHGIAAFCARSETGKTTIAHGMQLRGHPIWGDDALMIDVLGEGQPTCPRLPFETYLRASASAFFGESKAMTVHAEEQIAPLAAIYVLERASDEEPGPPCEISHVSLSERLPAMLSHAYFFGLDDPERKARIVEDYLRLLARVPILRISFRPDFLYFPRLLDDVELSLRDCLESAQ